jgi:hypothetical protein
MNGLNLDEIAVLLERHGITCVVRNEMERKPCGVFRRLPLPNRNNEQNTNHCFEAATKDTLLIVEIR